MCCCTVFALVYFVFEGNSQVLAPLGAYIRRGDLPESFFVTNLRGFFYYIFATLQEFTFHD